MKMSLREAPFILMIAILLISISGGRAYGALDIKVGYYDYDGFVTVDGEDKITGYAGDILDMMTAVNTHWKFIPVEFERASFLENMRKGFAVISVQSPLCEESPRFFVFSRYAIAMEQGIFYTSLEQNINYEDFEIFDGMRVGAVLGDIQNGLFDDYQAKNGFEVEYVFFNSLEEIKEALFEKDIDGLIYGSVVEQADLKIIARYAMTPLHVAANEWGAMLIEYFDRVLKSAYERNPDFLRTMYDKHYADAPKAIQALTIAEENALFESKKIAENEARIAAEAIEAARLATEESKKLAEEQAARQAAEEAARALETKVEQEIEPADVPTGSLDNTSRNRITLQIAIGAVVLLMTGIITGRVIKKGKLESVMGESKPKAGVVMKPEARRTMTRASRNSADSSAGGAGFVQDDRAGFTQDDRARFAQDDGAGFARNDNAGRNAGKGFPGDIGEDAAGASYDMGAGGAGKIPDPRITDQGQNTGDDTGDRARAGVGARPVAGRVSERASRQSRERSVRRGHIEPPSVPVWIEGMGYLDHDMTTSAQGKAYTEDQIRGEIYLSGLNLSLQPRYSVNQNRVVGAEVSIYYRHPIRDRVYPVELVQSLSDKGCLHMLDRYIFDNLCLNGPHEKVGYDDEFEIVVPVFTESVIQADFSEWYIEAARGYNVPPHLFRLDLVYRWQPEYDQRVYSALRKLSDAGFRIALKDVGNTNYPLSILSEIEMEAMVISEQLVIDALSNEKKKKLLMGLKSLSGDMGFRLEADRVDSREKFQLMSEIGCQVYQGNFLTRAIPFEQFWDYKKRLDVRYA